MNSLAYPTPYPPAVVMKLDVEGRLTALKENLDPHILIFEPAGSLILKANSESVKNMFKGT